MIRSTMALLALLLLGSAALAGPNAGGTLIAHDANLLYLNTNGSQSLCAQGNNLDMCVNADAEIDGTDPTNPSMLKIYAAFLLGSSPRVMGITWGLTYDANLVVLPYYGKCGDFELNDDGWPNPGTGSTVTWNTVQTSYLVQVYWFAAYSYGESAVLQLGPNPGQGGYFGDDSVPAILDPIAAYGSMGFDMPGTITCPLCPCLYVCCDLATGECALAAPEDCAPPHVLHPEWEVCDPNPCPPAQGACCECTGNCTITSQEECTGEDFTWIPGWDICSPNPCPNPLFTCCNPETGGCTLVICPSDCPPPLVFHPELSSCEPNPCPPPVPVERQSWGRVKESYR